MTFPICHILTLPKLFINFNLNTMILRVVSFLGFKVRMMLELMGLDFLNLRSFVSENSNLRTFVPIPNVPIPLSMIVSWVRGQQVSISAFTIREYYSLPHIEQPQFPFHPSVDINTDNALSILMGAAHKWDGLPKINTGFLLPDYRVLYSIYHHCIRQDSHHSEFNVLDSLRLYAIGTRLSIDLGDLIFKGMTSCLVYHHDGSGSYNSLVMGSLITRILVHFYNVPRYKKEITVKPSKGTYNLGSWHRSLSQAPIYERAANDADDHFLQMKARELIGSKGRIIQGSSRRTAHHRLPPRMTPPSSAPAEEEDEEAADSEEEEDEDGSSSDSPLF
ncbi:hypothetical protein LguiA_007915 [Lonicera macranthoides]